MPQSPHIEIVFCIRCGWGLRAAWMAQEILSTFSSEVGSVTLTPDRTGGKYKVIVDGTTIWNREIDGGFPEIKLLKQRVRDQLAPDKPLGHVDR